MIFWKSLPVSLLSRFLADVTYPEKLGKFSSIRNCYIQEQDLKQETMNFLTDATESKLNFISREKTVAQKGKSEAREIIR